MNVDRLTYIRASRQDDPLIRFLDVLRYYLSGWHIQPKVRLLLNSSFLLFKRA